MTVHPYERAAIPDNIPDRMRPHPYSEDAEAAGCCTCRLPTSNRLHGPVRLRLLLTTWAEGDTGAASTSEDVLHEEVLLTGWAA